MYNYAKTINELSENEKLSFIETREIRLEAAGEMLKNRAFRAENKYDIDTIKMGLGDSTEFKGV